MTFSIVIPVKNDAARLQRCLASIAANASPSRQVEVIVADNGSTDDTPLVARRAGARVLDLPCLRVSALRNAGARVATGNLIGFIDADHEIGADWVDTATEVLNDPSIGALGALYLSPERGTWVQRTYGHLRGRTCGRHDAAWLASGNLVVRRAAFESAGGFDITLDACEDVEFCQKLRANRWRVVGDERLASVHWGDPSTLRRLFEAERWRGQNNLRVSWRGPLTSASLPSMIAPALTLVALAIGSGGVALAPLYGRQALAVGAYAFSLVAAISGLRAGRMMVRARPRRPLDVLQALAVTFVYDTARAAALVTRASHHRDNESVNGSVVPA